VAVVEVGRLVGHQLVTHPITEERYAPRATEIAGRTQQKEGESSAETTVDLKRAYF